MRFIISCLTILLCLSACEEDFQIAPDATTSEAERKAMDDCFEDKFTSSSVIHSNIIGEWELVGYACGFCVPAVPIKGKAFFTQEGIGTIAVEYKEEKVETAFEWSIENNANSDLFPFSLTTTPFLQELQARVFCAKFMYHDFSPFDGTMYLWRKK